MRRIIIDLDNTITVPVEGVAYEDLAPNMDVVKRLREYRDDGFEIAIHTARSMRSMNNSTGRINAVTLPKIVAWLDKWHVPYDEVWIGKPWCGTEGFYVDDRAIRPSEFVTLSLAKVNDLLNGGLK